MTFILPPSARAVLYCGLMPFGTISPNMAGAGGALVRAPRPHGQEGEGPPSTQDGDRRGLQVSDFTSRTARGPLAPISTPLTKPYNTSRPGASHTVFSNSAVAINRAQADRVGMGKAFFQICHRDHRESGNPRQHSHPTMGINPQGC